MIKRLKMLRGIVLSAGRLKKNGLGIVMLLCVGLLLAGCSGSKSSDTGSYSGSVYTVKRGDTLYRISRATGTSVKEIARLNNISPPYTIEVGQKLKVSGGAKTSSNSGKNNQEILNQNGSGQTVFVRTAVFLATSRATLLAVACQR